jgi:F-box interacting protein
MQQRRDAVPLVVTTESVYVLDSEASSSNSKTAPPRELWPDGGPYRHMEAVGACNGVLCLCDDAKPGGAITLVNPATADALALPPIPRAGLFRRHNTRRPGRGWHQAYSFGYHHATGQYTVVHVPCFFKTKETLQVFTVGEAAWREVLAPTDARCKLDAGLVSVGGVTYWVTEASPGKIMSFDHRSEQVRFTKALPVSARRPICQLTQVHRRLSAATSDQIDHGYYSIEVIYIIPPNLRYVFNLLKSYLRVLKTLKIILATCICSMPTSMKNHTITQCFSESRLHKNGTSP